MVPEKILAVGDWDHFWIKIADELCSPQIHHLTFWFLDISIIFYIFYFYNAKIILLYIYICWWHTFQTGFDGGSSFRTLLLKNNQQHQQQLLLPSFTYPWACLLLVSPASKAHGFRTLRFLGRGQYGTAPASQCTQQGSPSHSPRMRFVAAFGGQHIATLWCQYDPVRPQAFGGVVWYSWARTGAGKMVGSRWKHRNVSDS